MYDRYSYSDAYFDMHDTHVMNTVANVLRDTFNVTAFVHNNRTVTVYGVDYGDLDTVLNLFGNTVFDFEAGGFFDNDDTYVLYFNVALVDADD